MMTPLRLSVHRTLLAAALALAALAAWSVRAGEPDVPPPLAAAPALGSLEVSVAVPGVDARRDGPVMFQLFGSPDDYQSQRGLVVEAVPVVGGRARVALSGLPAGEYAFSLFHDANRNGVLDVGTFGLPRERLYFSNDASDLFSAPEWEEASFRLPEGDYSYSVSLD